MIHILHPQTDEILGYLDNQGDNLFWDDEHEQSLDGTNIFSFKMLAQSKAAQHVEGRVRFLIPSEREGWQEFIGYHIVTVGNYKEIYATGAEVELDKLKNIAPATHNGFTLKQYINLITIGTEYQTGVVEYSGIKTLTFEENLGAYSFSRKIATEFDVEIVVRVEVQDESITGRYIDVVKHMGAYEGKEIESGKDLIEIERTNYSERIITALLCIGPKKSDGTWNEIVVTDADAFQQWNRNGEHLLDRYTPQTDDQNMTVARLEQLGKAELKKRIASVDEYKMTAAVIEKVYPNEKTRLGDTVRIKKTEYQPPLFAEARVKNVKRSLSNPNKKTYEVGELYTYQASDILAINNSLEKRIEEMEAQNAAMLLLIAQSQVGDAG